MSVISDAIFCVALDHAIHIDPWERRDLSHEVMTAAVKIQDKHYLDYLLGIAFTTRGHSFGRTHLIALRKKFLTLPKWNPDADLLDEIDRHNLNSELRMPPGWYEDPFASCPPRRRDPGQADIDSLGDLIDDFKSEED
jgi:hypothetical protein